ncbi:MAG: hypothetical protein AAGG44_18045, partial [Planctomycetota bacterium]
SSLNGLLAIHTLQDQVNETHDAEATREPLDVQKRVVDSSLEYFGRVTKLVDRVRKYEAQTTGYRAKWNDLNARRIDELNTLGVDEELQAYAADVSQLLRGNSVAIRNLNARAGQQKAASSLSSGERYATGGYRGFYGGAYGYRSGYYNPNSSADYQRVISAQASSAGFTSFKIILAEIDKRTGEIRRAMTQKYKYQF